MLFPEYVLFALSRYQIIAFLELNEPLCVPYARKMKKAQLVDFLYTLIVANERYVNLLLKIFPYALAVGPTETQQLLGCTAQERRLWIQEGYLPVLAYRVLWPTQICYPVHDRDFILSLTQTEVGLWRSISRNDQYIRRVVDGKWSSYCHIIQN